MAINLYVEFLMLSTSFMQCQYILPHEHEKLSQVELLVVDEAAAIPLPVVKSLLGPYLVFLASTVNGYEAVFSLVVMLCSPNNLSTPFQFMLLLTLLYDRRIILKVLCVYPGLTEFMITLSYYFCF